MKIHLDYLEGRVEELENTNLKLENEKKNFSKKIQAYEDKYSKLKADTDKEIEVLKKEKGKLQENLEDLDRKHRETIDKHYKELDFYK